MSPRTSCVGSFCFKMSILRWWNIKDGRCSGKLWGQWSNCPWDEIRQLAFLGPLASLSGWFSQNSNPEPYPKGCSQKTKSMQQTSLGLCASKDVSLIESFRRRKKKEEEKRLFAGGGGDIFTYTYIKKLTFIQVSPQTIHELIQKEKTVKFLVSREKQWMPRWMKRVFCVTTDIPWPLKRLLN